MSQYDTINLVIDDRSVARITLNRPEQRNAMNPQMIAELTAAIKAANENGDVRCLVLEAAGKAFCAGADLNWLGDVAQMSPDEIRADSGRLQNLFRTLVESPKLTIGRVQGAAMAGGLGLVACCDAVVCRADAKFSVSEVRLGLVPGVISSFLLARLGTGPFRYEALTGRIFDADAALRNGLVHALAGSDTELDELVERHVGHALAASPAAIADCKLLLNDIGAGIDPASYEKALNWNVKTRQSASGQEGITAFLGKRPADWVR